MEMHPETGRFHVGAGRAVLDLSPDIFPLEGFYGVHDALHSRAILLDGEGGRLAVVVVELTSLGHALIDELRREIAAETETTKDRVILCVSHTFSAPHIRAERLLRGREEKRKNDALRQAVRWAVMSSVRQAARSLRPARAVFGTGRCDVNVNRDVLTSEGWWKGVNPDGLSDKTLGVLRFENPQGEPVAFLANYPVQSSVLMKSTPRSGEPLVSADLLGSAAAYMESRYGGGVVAAWTVGAAGDQDPLFMANRRVLDEQGRQGRVDIQDCGFALLELLGERLGSEALRISESLCGKGRSASLHVLEDVMECPGQEIFRNLRDMRPRKEYTYGPADPVRMPYTLSIIGTTAFVFLQPEIVCKTSLEIKKGSPFRDTVLVTMANGGAKYLPDAESYDRITYASMNSFCARGSAELLRDVILEQLGRSAFFEELRGVGYGHRRESLLDA